MLRVERLEKKNTQKLFELSQLLIKRAQMIPECVSTIENSPVTTSWTWKHKNVLLVKRVTFFLIPILNENDVSPNNNNSNALYSGEILTSDLTLISIIIIRNNTASVYSIL